MKGENTDEKLELTDEKEVWVEIVGGQRFSAGGVPRETVFESIVIQRGGIVARKIVIAKSCTKSPGEPCDWQLGDFRNPVAH